MNSFVRQLVIAVVGIGLGALALHAIVGTTQEERPAGTPSVRTPSGDSSVNVPPQATPEQPVVEQPRRATVGDTTVFIETEGKVNRVVLERGGERFVLGEGELRMDANGENIGKLKSFGNVRLNASGRYVLVDWSGYEIGGAIVYDLTTRQIVLSLESASPEFTPDGRFVYACAANDFGGEYYGKVIELASKDTVYELPIPKSFPGRGTIRCGMESDRVVAFSLQTVDDRGAIVSTLVRRFDLRDAGEGKP